MATVGAGTIGPGGAEYVDVVLTAGRPHRVYVDPDDPTVDFDLHVVDENGNRVTEEITSSVEAFCIITPRWTGGFRLLVNAAGGASSYRILVEE
jgi:hypothetical protein